MVEHELDVQQTEDELAGREEALERLRTTSGLSLGGNAENDDGDSDVEDALASDVEAALAELAALGVEQQKMLDEREPLADDMDERDDTDGGIFSPRFKEKCRQLLAARDKHAQLDAARKQAKKELDELELDVFEMFEGLATEGDKASATLPVPLGEPYGTVKFRTRETHYAKIADEEAFMDYLEKRAMIDEVSGPSFVKRRLHEMVRQALDNHQPLPDGLTYYTDRGMTITRQK